MSTSNWRWNDVVRVQIDGPGVVGQLVQHSAMTEGDALLQARCAAGMLQKGDGFRLRDMLAVQLCGAVIRRQVCQFGAPDDGTVRGVGHHGGKLIAGEDEAHTRAGHQLIHVAHVNLRVQLFRQGGEHGRDGAYQQCAPESVNAFEILGVGDDDQIFGLHAQCLQARGVGPGPLLEIRATHDHRFCISGDEDDDGRVSIFRAQNGRVQQCGVGRPRLGREHDHPRITRSTI
jgi:hypothetical protein